MKDNLSRLFTRYQRTFAAFTAGQKLVAVIGTAALLLAGFMVYRWAATPSYAPLYSGLSSTDASAVVDKLTSDGIAYQLADGGSTVMVPQNQVYSARIKLAGAGLPSDNTNGYGLLDKGGLGQSQFQQDTNFKRAMEGELSKTIEGLNGVQTAVVHLALPQKQVFATTQDKPTASVLLDTKPGVTLDPEQVQAVTHLVASSIDGMDPANVTVTDAAGHLLSSSDSQGGAEATTRAQQIAAYEDQKKSQIQSMLDSIVGPGNSTVAVTANLDFDKTVTETKTYTTNKFALPLSESTSIEKYNGIGAGSIGGVVGPDGQMGATGTTAGTNGTYGKSTKTVDNADDTTIQHRESAPGSVKTLTIGVALNAASARLINPTQLQNLIAAGAGIDTTRGDRINVTTVPFDSSVQKAAAAELAAQKKADAHASLMNLIRNAGLVLLVGLVLLLAWLKGRKRAKARAEATTYVVEQLRQDALDRAQAQAMLERQPPASLALEGAGHSEDDTMREELAALVERQPEDVAALLRGWLVERP